VVQSHAEAVKWFHLAAAQGEPDPIFNLAECYENGLGVPRDGAESGRLCFLAAAKGHADAVAGQRTAQSKVRRRKPRWTLTDQPKGPYTRAPSTRASSTDGRADISSADRGACGRLICPAARNQTQLARPPCTAPTFRVYLEQNLHAGILS